MGTKKKKAVINAQQKQPDQTHDQDQEAAHLVAEVMVIDGEGETEVQPEAEPEPKSEAEAEPEPQPEPQPEPPPLTLESLHEELQSLKATIAELQSATTKRRKPVKSNGKIKIRDKKTGTVYPSKNNVYQSLLKAGELKELVDKGLFGDQPEKNSFGCYALFREWPDRFEEVKEEPTEAEQTS